jgi:16S rRNA processing protein RimM
MAEEQRRDPQQAAEPHSGQQQLAAPISEELLVVGRVVAAQGLKGELRVLPLSDFPERFTRAGRRWLRRPGGAARTVELRGGRVLPGKELFVVRIDGIESRDAAEAAVGEELLVLASDRPKLARGEFHLMDLVGLEVHLLPTANESEGEAPNQSEPSSAGRGELVGRVRDLLHAGNDLLEVELGEERGGRTILIPFVKAIVPVVKLKEGWVGITPPPGLLDL